MADDTTMAPEQTLPAPLDGARTMDALGAALRSPAADELEISVLARSGEYTRFAGRVIHQPQDITEVQYLVRAVVNGHPYRVATSAAADLDRGRHRVLGQRAAGGHVVDRGVGVPVGRRPVGRMRVVVAVGSGGRGQPDVTGVLR